MLTQIIEGNIMTPKLDDIVMRTGETNRIIIFRLRDGKGEAITAEDYSMEFIMQKPDGNFVIQTLGTITDGFYLHTVEQMAAAGGVGYYTLRITDNDDLIYTAHGSVIVDDNTLSDGDIESISDVNGLRFPDDFLTTDSHVALIDDTDTSADTTWSSDKITSEIGSCLSNVIDDDIYSNTKTWSSNKIDDKINSRPRIIYDIPAQRVGTWMGAPLWKKTLYDDIASYVNGASYYHGLPDGAYVVMIEPNFVRYNYNGIWYRSAGYELNTNLSMHVQLEYAPEDTTRVKATYLIGPELNGSKAEGWYTVYYIKLD